MNIYIKEISCKSKKNHFSCLLPLKQLSNAETVIDTAGKQRRRLSTALVCYVLLGFLKKKKKSCFMPD